MDGLGYVQTFIRCHRMVSDRLHTYWLPLSPVRPKHQHTSSPWAEWVVPPCVRAGFEPP